jgi:serine/threonine protein kinase
METMQLKQGAVIGAWQILRQLGKGGNGVVFEATDGERIAAVKVLSSAKNPKRVTRFADEIRAMQRCKGLPGVLPLYESFLPSESDNQPPWLAMPLAVPLIDALGQSPTFEQVIAAIKGVAAALVSIHEIDISHRDIKPDNLFYFNGTWVIGDFGIADFDGKMSETAPMEKIGPMHYIAPEMLNGASAADGKAADVYSLAKTMWVLGTGQRYPLPGHQLASTMAMTISAYTDHPRAALLDKLVEHSTNFAPTKRPMMQQFLREIDAWITPPNPDPALTHNDMGAYRRLLEGRLRKIQENEQATSTANERRKSQGIRVRERFRGIAVELCERLTEAGFLRPGLSMDNHYYGFQISATVPYELEKTEFHKIEITLHTNPIDSDGSQFVLEAWYRHQQHGSNQGKEVVLWQSNRDFFSGGSEEEQQVLAMTQSLRDELVVAIGKILVAAGVIGI